MTDTHYKNDFFCADVARTGITTSHKLLSLLDNMPPSELMETSNFSFGILQTQRAALPLPLRKKNVPLPMRSSAARGTVQAEAIALFSNESGICMNRLNQCIGVKVSQRTGETNVS